ncbi:MAG: hypothetical protein M1834_001891 [Cirrosporium novae-zelandiae]|nr:MAG: hypothetical protein M1834_001891 [Cirrosporium novae-zelandiae]
MEAAKNVMKGAISSDSQFQLSHEIPIQHQPKPGLQSSLKGPDPQSQNIPTEDGGYQTYKAAGKLQDKKAIITGGDSGIGRVVAILFAMEGVDSLIAYLPDKEKDAQETKKKVEEHGGKCFLLSTDVKSKENCKKIVDEALKKLGGINILINNAAYQNMVESIADLTEDQWEHTFNTNIHPYFYLSKYVLPHLHSGDAIVNNASVNHYIGRPDLLDYTATKGAIVAFTRGLSNQICNKGIRVNAVCPGPIWTPLVPSTMNTRAQESFSETPMGRPGQPSECATCFVFLASQDTSFMSGQCLHPNGGVIVNG